MKDRHFFRRLESTIYGGESLEKAPDITAESFHSLHEYQMFIWYAMIDPLLRLDILHRPYHGQIDS